MEFKHQDIAEYLESKICSDEYSDYEYGLYIEYKKFGGQVFEWSKNKKYVLMFEKELIRNTYLQDYSWRIA